MHLRKKHEKFDEERLERYLGYVENGMPRYDARVLADVDNDPIPEHCPHCGTPSEAFESHGGMVGEEILFCPKCSSIVWEDSVGAVRSVL
jgi:hypothetical protein